MGRFRFTQLVSVAILAKWLAAWQGPLLSTLAYQLSSQPYGRLAMMTSTR